MWVRDGLSKKRLIVHEEKMSVRERCSIGCTELRASQESSPARHRHRLAPADHASARNGGQCLCPQRRTMLLPAAADHASARTGFHASARARPEEQRAEQEESAATDGKGSRAIAAHRAEHALEDTHLKRSRAPVRCAHMRRHTAVAFLEFWLNL
eukprot:6211975-Pleurochrysis_carterae.AAC.2